MPTSLFPRPARPTPSSSNLTPEPWVDIHRAAEHLGVTVRWLYSDGDRAGVPVARIGRARRYQLSLLSAFMLARVEAA